MPRRGRPASQSRNGLPLEAMSSEATRVAQATPSATRSAVRMWGTVSGMITLRKISASLAPSVWATRTWSGVICETPSYITITPEKNAA